jgi:hypothetical protein
VVVRGYSPPQKKKISRSQIVVRAFQSIFDEISMSVIHRFSKQKMLESWHFTVFWVNKRRILVPL